MKKTYLFFTAILLFIIEIHSQSNLGNALEFNGTSNYVLLNNPSGLLEPNLLTFEAWVKRDKVTPISGMDRFMISKNNNGWGVGYKTTGKVFFTLVGVSEVVSTGAISDTNWHHIAITHDGDTARFYFDGVFDSKFVYNVSFSSNNQYTIASRGTWEYLDGKMDEVRVWDTIRSENEIYNNRCIEQNGNENNLIAYYNFNQNNSGKLLDLSPNANHGTLTSMDTVNAWVASTTICNSNGFDSEIEPLTFLVYPNPATDNINILFNNPISGSFKLLNMFGQVVSEGILPINTSPQLSVLNHSSGIYFLEIKSEENQILKKKIIIQK